MIGGLRDAVAAVTGGASGIGKACVEVLEECGATVRVADVAGRPSVDVTDRGALGALADEIREEHGGLDVLVNAAGILTENRPVEEIPVDDLRRNLEVNLIGTFQACQVFGPLLREKSGATVNIASQAALVSLPSQAAYTASKGGVAALTRSLAVDWAGYGVRANCVCPGFVRTPMTEAFFENETFTRAAEKRIPLGRLFEPREIAAVIVFLASPLASAITGVVLPIDGGWTAGEPALPW